MTIYALSMDEDEAELFSEEASRVFAVIFGFVIVVEISRSFWRCKLRVGSAARPWPNAPRDAVGCSRAGRLRVRLLVEVKRWVEKGFNKKKNFYSILI